MMEAMEMEANKNTESRDNGNNKKRPLISERTMLHASLIACGSLLVALIAVLYAKDPARANSIQHSIRTTSMDRDTDPY